MKKTLLLCAAMGAATSAWAQAAATPLQQPSQVISQPAFPSQNSSALAGNTNQFGSATLTFTNRAGQAFTADQLAFQLQMLRGVVERTLPVLSGFNESFGASASGSSSVSGGISNLLSGVLHPNSGQNAPTPSQGQASGGLNNVVGLLRGLVQTNTPGSAATNPSTMQQLIALQNELQAILPILHNLNVSSVTGAGPSEVISSPGATISGYPPGTNIATRPLSPTGR